MTHTSKNPVHNIPPGTAIRGKWHHCRYRVMRRLGSGANGQVYLAESAAGRVAVKIGYDSMSIASEVNVLKQFSKVQGNVLGPSLMDVDDWQIAEGTYPFYVMEYLRGDSLLSFVRARGEEWIGILIVQLLADLDRLHRAGWVFGDLKPDNLIVAGPPPRVRWFDVGGTTLLGRSVKEYTEFFDRGYWGLGSRKAEPSYDLFAVAMIMINTAYPRRFNRKKEALRQLRAAVNESRSLRRYRAVIIAALEGKYREAPEMRKDMVRTMSTPVRQRERTASGTVKTGRPPGKKRKRKHEWLETVLLGLFLFTVYFLYVFTIR
ncbi:MAG TPA: protein kinase family protein [Bacillales bacterium]|nr:protein kinase family protein [Bacillales bacterium]